MPCSPPPSCESVTSTMPVPHDVSTTMYGTASGDTPSLPSIGTSAVTTGPAHS